MSTYFVSRHPGACEWAQSMGFDGIQVGHLDLDIVQAGDHVLGTLPVNLAARVCARGARYWHLSMNLPAQARGVELDADCMRRYGARLEEFTVQAVCDSLGSQKKCLA